MRKKKYFSRGVIFVVCAAVQVLITLWELFRFSRTRTWF